MLIKERKVSSTEDSLTYEVWFRHEEDHSIKERNFNSEEYDVLEDLWDEAEAQITARTILLVRPDINYVMVSRKKWLEDSLEEKMEVLYEYFAEEEDFDSWEGPIGNA